MADEIVEVNSISKNGYFISKSKFFLILTAIVLVVIAEGLIIGLVGRPECDVSSLIDSTQPITEKPQITATTTKAQAAATQQQETRPWQNIRLPLNIVPYEYEVSLRPVLRPDNDGMYWFYGSSIVWFTCVEPTEYIILHSNKLVYDKPFVISEGRNNIELKRSFFQNENQFIVIEMATQCEKDKSYKMSVPSFKSELSDDLNGLYRSEYDNAVGEHVVIAVSQMESTGARETFPCFDEPGLKATFTITLWYEKNTEYYAVSNMPELSQTNEIFDGTEWVGQKFKESVPMSTYLLALVVCDFGYVETFSTNGIQTRIYSRLETIDNGEAELAKEISPDVLDFYESYFNVPYPLPKSDQMGVPDFSAGAMENWGLVIYRESYVLFDEMKSSVFDERSVVSIIAHELAHQWFGNLVSPAWWDDTWLNEGFASYVSYLGEQSVRPTWKSFERFVVDEVQPSLSVDSLTTSHPLVTEVNSPNEIQSQFDTISYEKGASILRMTNDFLGEQTFVAGLTNYLNAFAYTSATHDDLFNHWAMQAEIDNVQLPASMETIMETWTLQMGYPVVNCRQQQNLWTVTQEYFLTDPNAEPVHTEGSMKYGYKWYIPFIYKTSNELGTEITHKVWMEPGKPMTFGSTDYIIGNVGAIGFYRVNYESKTWNKILGKLKSSSFEEISIESRSQLISDAFNLATGQRLETLTALDISTYLSQELEYVPWKTFTGEISYFEYMLGRTSAYGAFEKYIQALVKPSIYATFAWNEQNTTDSFLVQRMTTQLAVKTACYHGDEDCIVIASDLFSSWMSDPTNDTIISTTYRTEVICTAIRNGGLEEWDFAWEKYTNSSNAQEQYSLRYGLSCSKDPWILNRYLEYCLDFTKVRKQDSLRTMQYVGGQEYGRDITWAFMVQNWDILVDLFGTGWSFEDLIFSMTKRFSTEYDLHLLEDFKNSTDNLGTASRGVDQAIESTKINIEWRRLNEVIVTNWLEDFVN